MGDETHHWFTARAGSMLAEYRPGEMLMGIIETHPDHPPILHRFGMPSEELKVDSEGRPVVVVTVANPLASCVVSVGSGDFDLQAEYEKRATGTPTMVELVWSDEQQRKLGRRT
jgi:hypothetical protein